MRRMRRYIYQLTNWPDFTWNQEDIISLLGRARYTQGVLLGKMEGLGILLQKEAMLETLTLDVLKSSEIEGALLHPDQVRSSIARHLGMDISGLVPSDRFVDGVVEMMVDAIMQYDKPLSAERLFSWHSALFPTGRSGKYKIVAGDWRKDETGPMLVVSGALGKEKIHFQAPDAALLDKEMNAFLDWFNTENQVDPVIKAGIAHLWFVVIHPFEDGNGRIARAIADMQLTRADGNKRRFYSMSAQIRIERNAYYNILEKTQNGNLDITGWLQWFLNCLMNALRATDKTLARVLLKAKFWEKHAAISLNKRQIIMINKLLDEFEGKLTSSKWAKISKCSSDTALRDINDLIAKEILQKLKSGGRSAAYELRID